MGGKKRRTRPGEEIQDDLCRPRRHQAAVETKITT
jgi:hypothetical protein